MLPSADTAAMLFWALLVSGQINIRKVGGWQTLAKTGLIYRTGSFAKGTQEAHRSPRCSANLSIC